MDQILNQLGGLVLGAVPTMVLFILLVAAYGFLVRRPLDRVLAERRARTSGAVEQAAARSPRLKPRPQPTKRSCAPPKPRSSKLRDKKLKQWNAEREAALAEVRKHTQDRIEGAKQEIEQSAQDARLQIVGLSDELSSRVLKAVLPAERPRDGGGAVNLLNLKSTIKRLLPGLLMATVLFAPVHHARAQENPDKRRWRTVSARPRPVSPEANKQEVDENDAYLHSASVRKLGAMLGLNPEQAATAFTVANFLVLAVLVAGFSLKTLPKTFRNRKPPSRKTSLTRAPQPKRPVPD